MTKEVKSKFTLILSFSLLSLLISPFIGVVNEWSISELVFGQGVAEDIFWRIRLPRAILGFLAGAALGGAGVVFQGLFKNPLASPYTLGVTSGASFGAVLMLKLGIGSLFFGISATTLGGLVGASLSTLIVYLLYSKSRSLTGNTMLLAGVVMSFFFSSLMLFAQYLSSFNESFQIIRWLMGGLETIDYASVICLTPFVMVGLTLAWSYARELDCLSTGEELAYSRGVDVSKLRTRLFFIISLMIGAVVSFTGPIGFVGIIVPHFTRSLLGQSHKLLIPATAFAAGGFLVLCDCLARIALAPAELPVGIVTAILGAPFFLLVLLSERKTY